MLFNVSSTKSVFNVAGNLGLSLAFRMPVYYTSHTHHALNVYILTCTGGISAVAVSLAD